MKVRLRQQLLAELSRRNINLIVEAATENNAIIHHLVDFVLLHQEKISSRAAWALDKISQTKPPMLKTRIGELYQALDKISESGTRRNVLKVLMQYEIPDTFESQLIDFALKMIESPKEPVAVKANSMTLIFNLLPK